MEQHGHSSLASSLSSLHPGSDDGREDRQEGEGSCAGETDSSMDDSAEGSSTFGPSESKDSATSDGEDSTEDETPQTSLEAAEKNVESGDNSDQKAEEATQSQKSTTSQKAEEPKIPIIQRVTSHPKTIVGEGEFRLPKLYAPGNQTDLEKQRHVTVRLGGSLARPRETCHARILMREFRESEKKIVLEEERASLLPTRRNSTSPLPSPLSPTSPSVLPVPRERRTKYSPRGVCIGFRRRRESKCDELSPFSPSYITQPDPPGTRLYRIFKTVRIITTVCHALKSYVREPDSSQWSFLELYLHAREELDRILAFHALASAQTEPTMSKGDLKLRKLLSTPPHLRTTSDVQQILAFIRSNASFQDYPADVQIKLCRCLLYQKYEPRRVVVKEGHPATAFYLVLSGSLLVNTLDFHSDPPFPRTVSILTAGACFGELALLEGHQRNATIICKSSVELLVILKDDFETLIRTPLVKQREQHLQFCQEIPVFRDFPCEKLLNQYDDFFFQYFPDKAVVIKDSRDCPFIVVVKSGKCRLVAKFLEERPPPDEASKTQRRELEKAFPLYTMMRRLNLTSAPKSDTSADSTAVSSLPGLATVDTWSATSRERLSRTSHCQERPPRPPLLKSSTLTKFYDQVEKERKHAQIAEEEETEGGFWGDRLKGPALRKSRQGSRSACKEKMAQLPFLRQDKISFAQVAELTPGDVFGLESVVPGRPTSLAVVSAGAECIFISKKLFMEEASIKVLRVVGDIVTSYPTQPYIRKRVRVGRDWARYRQALVQHILTCAGRQHQLPV